MTSLPPTRPKRPRKLTVRAKQGDARLRLLTHEQVEQQLDDALKAASYPPPTWAAEPPWYAPLARVWRAYCALFTVARWRRKPPEQPVQGTPP